MIAVLAILVVFLEWADRPDSGVKYWLYEGEVTHGLNVATVALQSSTDPDVNLAKMARFITNIKKTHPAVDLILFGEVILGSYWAPSPTYHQRIAQTIPGPATAMIARLAKAYDVYVSFGMPEKTDGKPHNAQVTIDDQGEIVDVQRKKDLRSDAFTPGERAISLVDIKGITSGIVICADLRSPEARDGAHAGRADLILMSNADYTDDFDRQHLGMRYMAKQFEAWIVVANRVGPEGSANWDGHIEVYNSFGDVVTDGQGREQFLFCRLRFSQDRSRSRRFLLTAFNKLSAGYLMVKNPRVALGYL